MRGFVTTTRLGTFQSQGRVLVCSFREQSALAEPQGLAASILLQA